MKTVTPLHSKRARIVCARAESGITREKYADLSIRMESPIQPPRINSSCGAPQVSNEIITGRSREAI